MGRTRLARDPLPPPAARSGAEWSAEGGPVVLIGVISDTHGLLRPEAVAALHGCALIVHAGDVGTPDVLDGLRAIAPVVAIRGNVDTDAWAATLPARETVRVEGHVLYVLHDLAQLEIDPLAAGVSVVISGHSHAPRIDERNGVLYLNPGSAGRRRFKLPVTLAHLSLDGPCPHARIIDVLSSP